MRRILFVTSGLRVGGAEAMLLKLVSRLVSARFEISVTSLSGEGNYAAQLRQAGAEVDCVCLNRIDSLFSGALKILQIVRRRRPDVMQGWMYHGNIMATFAHAFAGRPTRLVWGIRHSLHDLAHEPLKMRLAIRLSRLLSAAADHCVYPSVNARKQHAKAGFRDDRSVVIPNGFDIQRFSPPDAERRAQARAELGIAAHECLVAHLARFHPMKDHAGLVRAAALAVERFPSMRFVLGGTGVTRDNDALCGHLEASGIAHRFILLGELNDVRPLLSAADIFCLSSAWGEAFPNVLGEAMAMGVPCVTTDVGDCKEIVGDAGITVPPGAPGRLADALVQLASASPGERQQLGLHARRRVVSDYSIEQVVAAYERFYRSLTETEVYGR